MASLTTHNYMYVNAHTDAARVDTLGSGNSSFKLKHMRDLRLYMDCCDGLCSLLRRAVSSGGMVQESYFPKTQMIDCKYSPSLGRICETMGCSIVEVGSCGQLIETLLKPRVRFDIRRIRARCCKLTEILVTWFLIRLKVSNF